MMCDEPSPFFLTPNILTLHFTPMPMGLGCSREECFFFPLYLRLFFSFSQARKNRGNLEMFSPQTPCGLGVLPSTPAVWAFVFSPPFHAGLQA
jgi:hypothetical protein